MTTRAGYPTLSVRGGTWLSHFTAGLLEATWLAALLVTPLLCNPYAFAGFEPQKIVFLELLALFALTAAGVHLAETRGRLRESPVSQRMTRQLGVCFAFVALSLVVSAAISVVPSSSLWGDYEHRLNVIARLSLMVFGAVVAWRVRSRAQIERLIATAIAAAVPVAIYAIIQRAGADPLLRIDLASGARVPSLIGHAIFLGSYLLLIFPLCLWRSFVPGVEVPRGAERSLLQKASLIYHRLVAVLILVAFLATESRGPLLGLIAGLVFFASVGAVLWNRRRLLFLGFGLAGFCLVFLTVLSLPQSPLAPLRSIQIFDRFARIVPTVERDFSRETLWNEAWKLSSGKEPLVFPRGEEDRFSTLRPIFGFGPETIDHVLPLRFAGFGIHASPDPRLHNLFWDVWLTTGAAGLGGFLALIMLIFFHAYRWLGFVGSQRDRWVFWLAVPGSTAAGALGLAFVFGPGYLALGLPAGLVAGLMAVPFLTRFNRPPLMDQPANPKAALMLALLSAMAAHLVETAFAWQVAAPAVVWWIWAGLVIALILCRDEASVIPQRGSAKGQDRSGHAASVAAWPASALVIVLLGFGFSLSFSPLIVALIVTSAILTAFVWIAAAFPDQRKGAWLVPLGASILGAAAVGALAFGILKVANPGRNLDVPVASSLLTLMQTGSRAETLALCFVAVVLVLVVTLGFSVRDKTAVAGRMSSGGLLALLLLLPVAGVIAWTAILPAYRADVWAWWGARLAPGDSRASAGAYREAIALSGTHLPYRMHLLEALLTAAESPVWTGERDTLFREAEAALLGARAITKLDRAGYELGHLYLRWALDQQDAAMRLELGKKAAAMLDRALEFERESPLNWTERALVDLLILNQPEQAEAKLQKANAYSPRNSPALWAGYYQKRSAGTKTPELKRQYLQRAIYYLDRSARLAKMGGASPYGDLTLMGTMHRNLGEPDLAADSFREALQYPPAGGPWQANAMLAHLYLDKGERAAALQHAAKAAADAPAEVKPALQQLQMDILGLRQMPKTR